MKESCYRISTHEKLWTKRPGKSSATDVGGQREEAVGSQTTKNQQTDGPLTNLSQKSPDDASF